MKEIIIIKYGELSTKKDNLNFFLSTLKDNIKQSLKAFNYELNYDYGRMIIYTDKIDEVINKLTKVFGIHEINKGYIIDNLDLNNLEKELMGLLNNKEFKTFKVITKRSNKEYPLTSMDISKEVGSFILDHNKNLKVDLLNPEVQINIEIRKKEILVYFDKIKGLGGYPVGVQGKGLLMLSGGIDSPVAGYLAIKRGIKLSCLYFESPPHTSEMAFEKVKELANVLKEYDCNLKIIVINFTHIQEEILKKIPHDYLITIMRRMMYRICEKIAYKENDKAIINGESIGQVASQTLTSMGCINEVVKIPVIRPVACLDKLEIINLAKKINTYDISIKPYEDCCTIFVPKHPVINPSISKCEEYEQLIDVDLLINEAINNRKIINLNDNQYNDLL